MEQTQPITLEYLISEYQVFLKENLNSNEIIEISFRIQKSQMTVNNYLDTRPDVKGSNKAKNFIVMKGIVDNGLRILNKRGICKEK